MVQEITRFNSCSSNSNRLGSVDWNQIRVAYFDQLAKSVKICHLLKCLNGDTVDISEIEAYSFVPAIFFLPKRPATSRYSQGERQDCFC